MTERQSLWDALRQGPCRKCGKRWFIGWMVPNVYGVCSWRCLRRLP